MRILSKIATITLAVILSSIGWPEVSMGGTYVDGQPSGGNNGSNVPIIASGWYTPESEFTFDGYGTITAYNGTNSEVRVPSTIGGIAVTNIGAYAFDPIQPFGTPSLVVLMLPPTVTAIGDHAFLDCHSLVSIDMPNVTTIGDFAFFYCYSLATVDMPSVINIGNYVFDTCLSLATVDMPAVTSTGDNTFYECNALVSVNMPNVTTIAHAAFYDCYSLISVYVPNVRTIGEQAFYGCGSLTGMYFSGNAPILGNNVFGTSPCIAYYLQGRTGYDTWGYANTNTWVKADNIYSLSINGVTPDVTGNVKLATPVADGTYTMGFGSTLNGTITVSNGIIVAVQEATN